MDSKKHLSWLRLLETIAIDVAPVRSSKIAAAIVIKNKLISVGTNKYKSHPFQLKFSRNPESIYLHAEVDAIKNALKKVDVEDLKRATLYVARVKREKAFDRGWIWGNSRCCKGCSSAIVAFDIKNVYYTTDTYEEFKCL